eukprot:TRINITY_DN2053_c0_g1_i1.p1 TRINITY_DN2053_c0_g1~~TRINITY_DN2053_c0_g1_i1.p1  ORF type:complete len:642 (-),score=101.29 TRINITY_DN2053_c0_g1_i1:699-2342(-)
MATTCLFLAGKVEESPKKIVDVLKQATLIKHQTVLDPESKEFWDQKEAILHLERLLLQTIGFDFVVEHPYKFLLQLVKVFSGPPARQDDQAKDVQRSLVQVAWNFVNDSLRTDLCLRFQPILVAAAALTLGVRYLAIDTTSTPPVLNLPPAWESTLPNFNRQDHDYMIETMIQMVDTSGSRAGASPASPPAHAGPAQAGTPQQVPISHQPSPVTPQLQQQQPSQHMPRPAAVVPTGIPSVQLPAGVPAPPTPQQQPPAPPGDARTPSRGTSPHARYQSGTTATSAVPSSSPAALSQDQQLPPPQQHQHHQGHSNGGQRRDYRDQRDQRDQRDRRDSRDRPERDQRDQRDQREPRDQRDQRDQREQMREREPRDSQHSRDHNRDRDRDRDREHQHHHHHHRDHRDRDQRHREQRNGGDGQQQYADRRDTRDQARPDAVPDQQQQQQQQHRSPWQQHRDQPPPPREPVPSGHSTAPPLLGQAPAPPTGQHHVSPPPQQGQGQSQGQGQGWGAPQQQYQTQQPPLRQWGPSQPPKDISEQRDRGGDAGQR